MLTTQQNNTILDNKKPFKGPMMLCILDGFGEAPSTAGNAITQANTPTIDRFHNTYPHSTLLTHGKAVGLPDGQMGNSEVGHTNIGAGRIVHQALEQIRLDLETDAFADKPTVKKFLAQSNDSRAIHLIGMVSDGGVHSHSEHLLKLVELLNKLNKPIYIHAITDGRDTPPDAALEQINLFEEDIKELDNVAIASICGRFYAMDRDSRTERIDQAFNLYTTDNSKYQADNATTAIINAYKRDEGDEFISATALPPLASGGKIENGDSILFFNFRADRMRQIVRRFVDTDINLTIATMTNYDEQFANKTIVLYAPLQLNNTLGEIISNIGGTQLRIAETEKYAHVTFFFNGGEEQPFNGEDRIMVPSPKVHTYDLKPEMALPEVSEKLFDAIINKNYDIIICNIANGDMVGHTGNINAAIKAVEAIDTFLSGLEKAIKQANGELFITADHGNCDEMLDNNGNPDTSHSINPVPFFYIGRENASLKNGKLCDIAPTILKAMGLEQPTEMTGKCLISFAR